MGIALYSRSLDLIPLVSLQPELNLISQTRRNKGHLADTAAYVSSELSSCMVALPLVFVLVG